MVARMIALSLRDVAGAIAVAVLSWPVLNLLDRIALGLECAKVACQ